MRRHHYLGSCTRWLRLKNPNDQSTGQRLFLKRAEITAAIVLMIILKELFTRRGSLNLGKRETNFNKMFCTCLSFIVFCAQLDLRGEQLMSTTFFSCGAFPGESTLLALVQQEYPHLIPLHANTGSAPWANGAAMAIILGSQPLDDLPLPEGRRGNGVPEPSLPPLSSPFGPASLAGARRTGMANGASLMLSAHFC